MAGKYFAKKHHRKGIRSLRNLKPTEKGADLSKYAGILNAGLGKSGSFWKHDSYNFFETTTLAGFDGNNKIYEKETCILVQNGSVNYQLNEYFMDYNIYLNGMKVGYYLTDYAGNGNLEGTASFYCLYDGQGNIVQISNKVGDIPYYLFKYDSYGNTLDCETDNPDLELESSGYKGYSESAIYFKTGVRHYDPNTGTFISPDPFKGYMSDPQSQHPYMYCHGNPIKYSDPSGYNIYSERAKEKMKINRAISDNVDNLMFKPSNFPGACFESAIRAYRLIYKMNLVHYQPMIVHYAPKDVGLHYVVVVVRKTQVDQFKKGVEIDDELLKKTDSQIYDAYVYWEQPIKFTIGFGLKLYRDTEAEKEGRENDTGRYDIPPKDKK
jgi:RHS repeat-associated protein